MIAEPINGINGRQILVATAHFESSKSNGKERKSQMEAAFQLLDVSKEIIFCGDFNFDNSVK